MIVLDITTDKIKVKLDAAITTNQLACVACWRDINTSGSYVAGNSAAATNGTTSVDLVASPAASTQRIVEFMSICNIDTVAATVTVTVNIDTVDRQLIKITLAAGERLQFISHLGFTKQ